MKINLQGISNGPSLKDDAPREELKPSDICCPEGVWSREAFVRLAEKEAETIVRIDSAISAAQRLIEALITTPEIEVFTICSYSGKKEPMDRDLLRSRKAGENIVLGKIPYSDSAKDPSGKYIFLDRVQFEDFINDKTISSKSKLDDMQSRAIPFTASSKEGSKAHDKGLSMSAKEKTTLLKMIIGMALDGYGYDPKASRSPIPREISDALKLKGLTLDEDTVRKWLKEAAETHLDRTEQDAT